MGTPRGAPTCLFSKSVGRALVGLPPYTWCEVWQLYPHCVCLRERHVLARLYLLTLTYQTRGVTGRIRNWLRKELPPLHSVVHCGTLAQPSNFCEFLFSYLQNRMVILICVAWSQMNRTAHL